MTECIPGMLVYDGDTCIWFNLYRASSEFTYELLYNCKNCKFRFNENELYSVNDGEYTL